jgi:hypothetical protein
MLLRDDAQADRDQRRRCQHDDVEPEPIRRAILHRLIKLND